MTMGKSEEIYELDFNQPIIYIPIRHHSPACSHHVKRAIELYNPDCILIEGPCDTDKLLPAIAESKPPVAIYYSYGDANGKHACYYPMLDFSPEFTAVQEGGKRQVPVHFIDLPFGNLVVGEREYCEENEGGNETVENGEVECADKAAYYNEYFLRRSRYVELLCERENCRHYNELWEKLFELPATKLSTQDFVRNMAAMCLYSRADYPDGLLKRELNDIREAFMAENIIGYAKKYKRVIVVTGGFHTSGLVELVAKGKPDKIKPLSGQTYLIPYSFEECDRLTGYQSGMPYPGFYQTLHELQADSTHSTNSTSGFANKTVMQYLVKIAKTLRKYKENVSISEEAAAYSMCLGLARLRGKDAAGVYELTDAVRGVFVKGELNLSTSFVLKQTTLVLRGKKIGAVGDYAPVPPIVNDFHNIAKSFRMDVSSSRKKEVTLDIVSKARHREQSAFLHRLDFLDNPYAVKTYGPDYVFRINTKLIREKWSIGFSGKVISALIEKSHHGGTVAEAASSMLSYLIENYCHNSAGAGLLLVKAGVMGLFEHTDRLIGVVFDTVNNDHSFTSLADCIKSLVFLEGVTHILRLDGLNLTPRIKAAKTLAITRVIPLLRALSAADEKEDYNLAETVKMLGQTVCRDENSDAQNFYSALLDLHGSRGISPSLDGGVTGLLHTAGLLSLEKSLERANGYFHSKGEFQAMSGRFLRGLFLTAKDLVFYEDSFLEGLNQTVEGLDYDEFMLLLADLRLAFTFFTPREIDVIAKKVAKILKIDTVEKLTELPAVGEKELAVVADIDRRVTAYLLAENSPQCRHS